MKLLSIGYTLNSFFEFSIYKVWKSVRYAVSKGLDTAYSSFLERGYTLFYVITTSDKVLHTHAIKKKTKTKSPAVPVPQPEKKAELSAEQLLLTLMDEVKSLKEQIKVPSDNSPYVLQTGSSKSSKRKQTTWFGPFVNKTLTKLKAQSSVNPSAKKAHMIPKPFKDCEYCGFNNHHSDKCEYYHGCKVCGSVAHELVDCPKKHPNSKTPRIINKRSTEPTKKYSKESSPKVVFGDDSLGDTEGYGSVNCNGITFTMVAYMNGLKHNLISINQLCDANFKVLFTKTQRTIFNQNDEVLLIAPRRRDVYVIDMSSYNEESNACFFAKASPSVNWLWHKRLSHLNFKNINKHAKQNLVAGIPSSAFSKDKNYSACEKGKHQRASFKTKRLFSINKCLHLLHMDLFGPVKPQTISHNKYTLVIIDEYSRYIWYFFLKKKSDAADCIMSFVRKIKNLNEGISQNFSSPCTLEQNGVAERRNKTMIEVARTMLNSAKLPKQFWREAVNTACYTQKRSIIVKRHGKTAYDVFRGRSPDISYFYVFGYLVHIHNHRDHLGKFDEKADDGFFLSYSLVAKSFRVFNIRRQEMEKTYHVTFSEDDEAILQSSKEGDAISMKIDPSLMMNFLNLGGRFVIIACVPMAIYGFIGKKQNFQALKSRSQGSKPSFICKEASVQKS
ncbi:retrovirus-related pol polyprotein from transposon TNT 1-94 [Tanacetum coccineum]